MTVIDAEHCWRPKIVPFRHVTQSSPFFCPVYGHVTAMTMTEVEGQLYARFALAKISDSRPEIDTLCAKQGLRSPDMTPLWRSWHT